MDNQLLDKKLKLNENVDITKNQSVNKTYDKFKIALDEEQDLIFAQMERLNLDDETQSKQNIMIRKR